MSTITKTYTTSGTFSDTIPIGCTKAEYSLWGGGGAGSGSTIDETARAGAAGGQFVKKTINNPTIGSVVNITVAAVKIGTTSSAGAGNDSYVSVGGVEVARAKGGNGASGNIRGTGSTTDGVGDTIYAGGSGAIGVTSSYQGGGGGGANSTSTGSDASGQTGGNSSDGGDGGDGVYVTMVSGSMNGSPGIQPGGGGGGGFRYPLDVVAYGGDGAAGKIIAVYTISDSTKHYFML